MTGYDGYDDVVSPEKRMKILNQKQHVTIKQVANLAGVSQMTVSRVVNKQGLVKETTRLKVQKAIDELNYRPNLNARRLASGKALFIGLVYHNPSPGYLTKILVGGLSACRENGHHLVLEDLGQHMPFEEPKKTAEALARTGLDGVIVTPPLSDVTEFVDTLDQLKLPVIRIAVRDIETDKLHVSMDDEAAVTEIVNHIISRGHKNIAFIRGPENHPSTHHRFAGYKSAMKDNGLDVVADYVKGGDFTYKSGLDAALALLNSPTPPTAIFASNDDMAAGAVTAAYMKGMTVPKDLSVAGFDDTEIATNIWPQLTTIRQPISEMSERAVNLLAAHIHGADSVQTLKTILDFELIERDSIASPK